MCSSDLPAGGKGWGRRWGAAWGDAAEPMGPRRWPPIGGRGPAQDGEAFASLALQLSSVGIALLAVALVITVAQLLGLVAERLGQPRVLGDIVGGIVLGPSLLGALAPQLSAWLFSAAVRTQLSLLGQLGLGLFMFLVGQIGRAHV